MALSHFQDCRCTPCSLERDAKQRQQMEALKGLLSEAREALRAAEKRAEDAEKREALRKRIIDRFPFCPDCRDKVHSESCYRCALADAVRERDEARTETESVVGWAEALVDFQSRAYVAEEALAASQALVRSLREQIEEASREHRKGHCLTAQNALDAALAEAPAQVPEPDGVTWDPDVKPGLILGAAQVAPEPEAPICCEGMGWNRRAGRNFPHTSDCTRGVSPSSPEPADKERA